MADCMPEQMFAGMKNQASHSATENNLRNGGGTKGIMRTDEVRFNG
jgi:hypothetical protein